MNNEETVRQDFMDAYRAFFDREKETLEDSIECSGTIRITQAFLFAYVSEPGDFIVNLNRLGITCDCKFIQALSGFLFLDSPYSFDKVIKDDNGLYMVHWELTGFNMAIEAMHANKAIGIKVNKVGYFPPDTIMELVVNIIDEHKTVVVLDKNGFSPMSESDNEGAL